MRTAFLKDTFREIKGTLNRFIAILAIVALGVGFFAGLKATTPDMQTTASVFYDEQNFMDVRLLSTMGITEDDVEALKALPYMEGVMPSYTADVLIETPTGNNVTRVSSLPADLDLNDPDYINRVIIEDGRLPEKPGECIIDVSAARGGASAEEPGFGAVGNTITLSEENLSDTMDLLKEKSFRVVGTYRTPLYISFQLGSSDIGSGILSNYMMILEEDFDSEYYLEVYGTVKGAEQYDTFSEEYDEFMDGIVAQLEDFTADRAQVRYDDIYNDAMAEITDAEQEVADAEKDVSDAETEWSDGQTEYEEKKADAERQLQDALSEIQSGESEVAGARRRLNASEAELESGEKEYQSNLTSFRQQIADAESQIAAAEADLASAQAQYDAGYAQLQEGEAQYEALTAQIAQLEEAEAPEEELAPLRAQAEAAQAQLAATRGTLSQAAAEIQAGRAQLENSRSQLASQRQSGQAQLDAARARLESGRSQLTQGRRELAQAERELASGRTEYEEKSQEADQELADGQKELDDARNEIDDAYREIADARKEIEDARSELADVEKPEWYVLDRNTNLGFASFKSDSQKIGNLSDIFPVFFFAVAALVCLTTMTRMVEEQRTQIGVLKALGYGKGTIASKYLIYAALATVLGCVIGLAAGFRVFPETIWHAYGIMYTLRPVICEFNWPLALWGGGTAVAVTLLAALWAVYSELTAVPADLIRPKAPPPGKRVILEKIPFIWKHLNFTQKVTARNLFRYKKRFFMTVLGIMGCTALMLTGFGLRDAIGDIATVQFSRIHLYDMIISLEDTYREPSEEVAELLADATAEIAYVTDESGTAVTDNGRMDVHLVTMNVPEDFDDFVLFRERTSHAPVKLPDDDTVVVTEKLADRLGIQPGDTITLVRGDTDRGQAVVGGITENYVYNYVYMTPQIYESLFGGAPEYSRIWANTAGEEDLTQAQEDEISTELLKSDLIDSLTFTSRTSRDFAEIMQSLDAVVWLLIGCSSLLAFIVLYNLVNINITERMREIATLKVLGFFDREVSSYVFRENILLTAIGALIGLLAGVALHQYVVAEAEVEIVMFGRSIYPMSYVYSFVLTMLFAFLVNGAMHFKLRRIDMVESLKSAE